MAASPSSSHLVLARKWRPERFEELVGQEHVTRTLAQALRSGRIAHAFLFTGIRGVGKTTAARILARCLNCEHGPTPEPCGTCAACLEIRAGGALDTVEIDGATYRKIDDARAIIENLGYRPARDRFKIYIIDEAHQLTDQAFNALLKTLEEPPPHVKFILATTEPQKMPETILSRLQRYDFRRIPFATILARLKQLAGREEAVTDDAALGLLAREAGGSMRDAERMLETAIASLAGKVSEAAVAEILGVASRSRVIELTAAVIAKDAAGALAAIRELYQRGANLESLGRDILEVLRNLAVARLPGADSALSPLADLPDQEAAALRDLAGKASLRDFLRLFHLLADAQEQLLRSPYPDLIMEMALVRMATLAPVIDADELLRAIGAAGMAAPADESAGAAIPAQAPPVPPAPSARPKRRISFNDQAEPPSAASGRDAPLAADPAPEQASVRRIPLRGEVKANAPAVTGLPLTSAPSLPGPDAAPAAAATGAAGLVARVGDAPPAPAGAGGASPIATTPSAGSDLPDLRDFIRGRRAALAGFMEQGATLRIAGDTITVTPRSDIYVRYLGDNRNAIADLASELYGRKIKVEFADPTGAGPAEAQTSPAATVDQPTTASAPAATAPVPFAVAMAAAQSSLATDDRSADTAATPDAEAGTKRNAKEAREALYSDPVVRRIFNEFEARLVEVRAVNPSEGTKDDVPGTTPKK